MLIGAGAGTASWKAASDSGKDIANFCNIDPVPAQLLDPKKLAPGIGELTDIMVNATRPRPSRRTFPPHCSMGSNQTWMFLQRVADRRREIRRFDAEAVRKAALDVDIGAWRHRFEGYGVKFFPPGTQLAGQNGVARHRSSCRMPVSTSLSCIRPNMDIGIRWLPLPKSSVYATSR